MTKQKLPEGWQELTPAHMACGVGMCPALFRNAQGDFVLVGKLTHDPDLLSRIGEGEVAITVPAGLLPLKTD